MRFSTTLNNVKCMEWELNASESILFSLLYDASSWAKEIIKDEKAYYFVSRKLITKELPMFFEKEDTVYRNFKKLVDKGLIEYVKKEKMDLVRITEKGKSWNKFEENSEKNPNIDKNSEKNPSKFGKKSEKEVKNSEKNPSKFGKKSEKEVKNSEKNPTYNNINIYNNNKFNNIYIFQDEKVRKKFEYFLEQRRIAQKDLSQIQIDIFAQKLYEHSNGNIKKAIDILDYSIMGNYPQLYPQRTENGSKSKNKYASKNDSGFEVTEEGLKKFYGIGGS